MPRPIIGLTGPMAAGKNQAADFFAARGYAVADADRIAHQALEESTDAVLQEFGAIAEERGIQLRTKEGRLDRRALGSLLFADSALLFRHEALIYPRIDTLLSLFITTHSNEGVVINAPLLHKSAVLSMCTFVIYIDACAIIRLYRAIRRDNLPFKQILARFSAQKNLYAQYLVKNVDIQRVPNRGSIRMLEKKLDTLLVHRGY